MEEKNFNQENKQLENERENKNIMVVNVAPLSVGSAEMRGTKITKTLDSKFNLVMATRDGLYPRTLPVEVTKLIKLDLPIIKYISVIFSLVSLILKRNIDIIIAEQYSGAFFSILASKIAPVKVILDYHGVWVDEDQPTGPSD